MTCEDVRPRLLDYQRARLPDRARDDVRAHLETCADCTRAAAVEQELSSLLEERLPVHPASHALKQRLAEQWRTTAPDRSWWSRWRPTFVPALAVASLIVVATPLLYYERTTSRLAAERNGMVAEAVNDHLRVLTSQHPLDVESTDVHQVKPWFEGRLDFAPPVSFGGDADFPLKGGAVGYFRDRKAALFFFTRRLHPITLLVVRAEGLPWPQPDTTGFHTTTDRGFTVMMWRTPDLGYALISDVDSRDLQNLATRVRPR